MSDLPDLTFPSIAYGSHGTPRSLNALLYRGGASTPTRTVASLIECGHLGSPLLSRVAMIKRLHESIAGEVALRKSSYTIENTIRAIRSFTAWCDDNGHAMTVDSAARDYHAWTEALLHRVRVQKDVKHRTVYGEARYVDHILSKSLDITRGLLRLTRLRAPAKAAQMYGTQSDKQNLEKTFVFGHVLLDVCDALSIDAVRGPLPVEIPIRNGGHLTEWSRLRSPQKVKALQGIGHRGNIEDTLKRRADWIADASTRTRFSLINLRIEAELLIFIAQTGMNLAQAHKLKRGRFRYQTEGEDVLVYRVYKRRRGGEAEFRVYKAYRKIFEHYLQWVAAIVPQSEDQRLFPFIYPHQIPPEDSSPRFKAIRIRARRLGMDWVGPRELRKTRVNWLLRRSRDPALTAEMAQHSKEVLFHSYEQPHHQVAAIEITRFHRLTDPAIAPPGPGWCVEVHRMPRAFEGAPSEAPAPDCVSPAGCLFCDFHRDIDSEDYVWSLASYRHLKLLELRRYAPPAKEAPLHPAASVADRITAKLRHLELGSETRSLWVRESLDRIREGRFHPAWDGFIGCAEAPA